MTGCETKTPWATAPPLPLGPTQETATVAVGDKLYVIGGFVGLEITPAVQIFDTATCSYTMGPELPRRVHHANATVVDGTIYVTGALVEGFAAIGDAWAWNPATEAAWTVKASIPAGGERGSAVTGAIDGKIIVAGGLRAGNAVLDVSVYDPATDQWSLEAELPAPRDHGCGGVVDGKLYVTGGRQANIGSTSPLVFELTPGGGWTTRAPMPTGRGGTGCGVVGERIVVVGGEGNPNAPSGVFPQVEAYTPATDSWETLAPMPTPRHGMGAAAVGDRLYVPGGATTQGFGAVATHEILTP